MVADPALERASSDPRASAIVAAARRLFETIGVWERIAGRAADPRHGGHRQPPRRRHAADVPDLRWRGGAGRTIRPHDRERPAAGGTAGEGEGRWRRAEGDRGRGLRRRPSASTSACRRRLRRPPAGRRRRRALVDPRARRHRDPRLGLRPVEHRHDRAPRARPRGPRRGALPARRPVRDPAAQARRDRPSLIDRLDRRTDEAERIVALDDAGFHAELEKRFGLHLGEIRRSGRAARFRSACTSRAPSWPIASRWSATPRM